MLADGASTPIWSKVSDVWGRKPILLIAVVAFFIGSTLCATAVSMKMLIVGRAIQGFGGGGLLTLSQIVISDMFSLRERGKYYGFIGMTWAIANSLGPLIGGALSEKVSWRWCFYINRAYTNQLPQEPQLTDYSPLYRSGIRDYCGLSQDPNTKNSTRCRAQSLGLVR